MTQDQFLARCHPHSLGEDGKMDLAKCEDLARDMSELRSMGVVLTLVGNYSVGQYRYSNLKDALAQARLERSENAAE
ncbi:hypothetical protein [Altererythrobacter sp. MF3-039]|uniref:hypothetical protein n=1 Tax=Altererythrobacter sp. MF3-039 TaxID=3252901 RepID=UPI00390C87D6